MNALRKFLRLNRDERAALAEAGALVVAIRIAQWILPWRAVVGTSRVIPLPVYRPLPVESLAWAVRAVGARIPRATCLTQSLALHRLMDRSGHQARVQIGVAKIPGGGFEFHAWVEHAGQPLLNSAGDIAQYATLLTLESPSA